MLPRMVEVMGVAEELKAVPHALDGGYEYAESAGRRSCIERTYMLLILTKAESE